MIRSQMLSTTPRRFPILALLVPTLALAFACQRVSDATPDPAATSNVTPPKSEQVLASNAAPTTVPARLPSNRQESPSAAAGRCTQICEQSSALHCKAASECEHVCRAMASADECPEQLADFYQCLSTQPLKAWECLEDGSAAIREGFCEAEQGRFAACLQKEQAK